MADTLNVTGKPEQKPMLEEMKKRMESLLKEREEAVNAEGPQSAAVHEIDERVEQIVAFCERVGITVVTRAGVDLSKERSERSHDLKIAQLREQYKAKYWEEIEARIAEEEREEAEKRLPAELKKAKKMRRQGALEERANEEGLKMLHVMPEEDPAVCEIAYKGPVFRVINPGLYSESSQDGKNGYNPFLLSTYVLGRHKASFHERREMGADFVASLQYDPSSEQFSVKAIDPLVTLRRAGSDAFGPFMQSTYVIEEGDVVRMKNLHLMVERAHGYSVDALFEEARSHLAEMADIIFDVKRTTEKQDLEAYRNMERIFGCNLPKEKKLKLAEEMRALFDREIGNLWAEIQDWRENDPVSDVAKFAPLSMLLKEVTRGNLCFAFDLPMDIELMSGEVGRRMALYSLMAHKSDAPSWVMVEMARFLEMGWSEMNFWELLDEDESYKEAVERIMHARQLIDALHVDEKNQLKEIRELLNVAGGLKLEDVFGKEEIAVRNQDIDLSLSPKLFVAGGVRVQECYVAQMARNIARKAYERISQQRSVLEKRDTLMLIKELMEMGLVEPLHLVEFTGENDPLAQARDIEQRLQEIEAGIASSMRREELRLAELEQAKALAKKAFEKEYEYRGQILDQAISLVEKMKVIDEDLVNYTPADVYELISSADLFLDQQKAALINSCMREVLHDEGKGWSVIFEEWQRKLMAGFNVLIVGALKKKNSSQVLFLAKKYAGMKWDLSRHFNPGWENLEKAAQMEQFMLLREVVMKGKAGEKAPEWLSKEDVQKYEEQVDEMKLEMARKWLDDFVGKVKGGDDPQKYKPMAQRLLNEVPDALQFFTPEEMRDLLL